MNLIEIVKKYQDEVLEKGILINYSLFFHMNNKNYCRFVIDENEELDELNNVILRLVEKDRNAEIYVSTYSINFAEENTYIYADTLWINSVIDVEELYNFFKSSQNIEPSDVVPLVEDETIDGEIAFVVSAEDKLEDYRPFIKKRQLSMIKSLYWD